MPRPVSTSEQVLQNLDDCIAQFEKAARSTQTSQRNSRGSDNTQIAKAGLAVIQCLNECAEYYPLQKVGDLKSAWQDMNRLSTLFSSVLGNVSVSPNEMKTAIDTLKIDAITIQLEAIEQQRFKLVIDTLMRNPDLIQQAIAQSCDEGVSTYQTRNLGHRQQLKEFVLLLKQDWELWIDKQSDPQLIAAGQQLANSLAQLQEECKLGILQKSTVAQLKKTVNDLGNVLLTLDRELSDVEWNLP